MDVLKGFLAEKGADLVGFADMRGFMALPFPFGVSVAVKLPRELVLSIQDGPNLAYYHAYHEINSKLNAIVFAGAHFLASQGYRVLTLTATAATNDANYRVKLPHKTVATRAGLGWVGKCALLVTKEYGSAVRLSSFFTDAPLNCAEPVEQSCCGSCRECEIHCPGGAVRGGTWQPGVEREALLDADLCRETARALTWERTGEEQTLCGRCFAVCPHTKRYLAGDA